MWACAVLRMWTQQHVRLFKAFIYRLFEQIFLMEVHLYKKQLSLVRHLTLCHTSRQRWGILAFSSGFFFSLFKNQFWAFDEHVNGLFIIALRDVHSLLFLLHVQSILMPYSFWKLYIKGPHRWKHGLLFMTFSCYRGGCPTFPSPFVNHPLYRFFTQYCCQVIKCSWLFFIQNFSNKSTKVILFSC